MSSYWAGYFGNFSCWIHVLEFSALSFQARKWNEIRIVALRFGRHGINDLWVTASGRLTCRLFGISSLGDRLALDMRENSQRWHTRANDTYMYLDGVLISKRRIIPFSRQFLIWGVGFHQNLHVRICVSPNWMRDFNWRTLTTVMLRRLSNFC